MTGARLATHRRLGPGSHRPIVALRWSAAGAAAVIAILVAGGYGLGWRWTGLSGSVTLWDWLEVLALPVALGSAPIVLLRRHQISARNRLVLTALLAAFVCLVVVGYLVPLAWTGFTGNTLWDWLELVLLPLVVGTASLWPSIARFERRHLVALAVPAAVFACFVAAGYLVPWTWTGFRGNTAWDWVKLLLLPLLIPTTLLPFVKERLHERLPEAEPANSPRRSSVRHPAGGTGTG
jgi:hypothetical protein